MPTQANNEWSEWVQQVANERGTTTSRWRDILYPDLEQIRYSARMGGVEMLVGTHLDIAREDYPIQVATHYTRDGEWIPYLPFLDYLEGTEVHYVQLPSWNGEEAAQATTFDELPENAQKYLAFLQEATGYPLVEVTHGTDRKNLIQMPGYTV